MSRAGLAAMAGAGAAAVVAVVLVLVTVGLPFFGISPLDGRTSTAPPNSGSPPGTTTPGNGTNGTGGNGTGNGTGSNRTGGNGSGTTPSVFSIVPFNSTVDGTPLSYLEWLPAGYDPARAYPFLLYLHGQANDCTEIENTSGGQSVIAAGNASGFIVASLCTRTNTGFYVNSPYTGPQEQDLLDAIASEKARHAIRAVYVWGTSMGTIGALSLAEHHPGLVAGVGIVSACPDLFEVAQYRIDANLLYTMGPYLQTVGGQMPSAGGYALAQTYYLSAFRFFPQNLSGVRLYAVQGALDNRCPNNPAVYPFQQANNTILNSTCLTVANQSEPANCTTPFAALAQKDPAQYAYRYVDEPTGVHAINDVDGWDMIAYFLNQVPGGLWWSAMGSPPYAPP